MRINSKGSKGSKGSVEEIASRQNPLVKYVGSLHQRKYREREKRFLVEGLRLLQEASKMTEQKNSGFQLETLLITPDWLGSAKFEQFHSDLAESQVRICVVSDQIFNSLSQTANPQGIMGVIFRTRENTGGLPTEVLERYRKKGGTNPALLILDQIQDPGNLGTLIRTAEAAGIEAIFLTPGSVDPFSAKVVRATMGSIFRLPIYFDVSLEEILQLGDLGVALIAAETHASKAFWEMDYQRPFALVLGNEGNGLSPELQIACTEQVRIPLDGQVESLNVAVAGAILLFETKRQRFPGT